MQARHPVDKGARNANVRCDAKPNAAIAAAGQGARSSLRGSRGEEPPGGARRSGDLRAHKRARSGGVKGSTKPPAQSAHTGSVAKAVLWKTAARSRAEEVASDKNSPVCSLPNLNKSCRQSMTCGEWSSQVSTAQRGDPGAGQLPCRWARRPSDIGARDTAL